MQVDAFHKLFFDSDLIHSSRDSIAYTREPCKICADFREKVNKLKSDEENQLSFLAFALQAQKKKCDRDTVFINQCTLVIWERNNRDKHFIALSAKRLSSSEGRSPNE